MSDETVRITTWNCRSGSIASRLQDVVELKSDIVFLQEWQPGPALPLQGDLLLVRGRPKGAGAGRAHRAGKLERIERAEAPTSSIAALATGPFDCLVLGVWTHPPDYRAEIDQLTAAFGDLIAKMPTVLMGDTGPRLGESLIKGGEVFARLADLGLVSAYHAHHGVHHGQETHATYFHASTGHSPWHIDYCLVSRALLPRVPDVQLGDDEPWAKRSDHRPLSVTLAV